MGVCSIKKSPAIIQEHPQKKDADAGVWRGAQIGPRSSPLLTNIARKSMGPNVPCGHITRPTADDTVSTPYYSELSGKSTTTQPNSHRNSKLTERIIWLVCEDCGSSKRIVESVGDPERYFYDNETPNTHRHLEAGSSTGAIARPSSLRRV